MVTRITGMASGMDIDSIVKKLMTAEKAPLDKMNQQKQLMEWKRESYREASSKVVSFLQDKLQTLSLSSSINAQKSSVTGNTDALTANATAGSSGGSMDITVTQLATASRVTTSTWTANTADTKSFASLFSSASPPDPAKVPDSVTIGGDTFTIDANETISSFVQKVNGSSTSGVTAIYDKDAGLSLTNKATGSSPITIKTSKGSSPDPVVVNSTGSDFVNAFKLDTPANGKDAKVTINGLSMTKPSNNFSINGVELSLKVEGGASTHIEVTKDTDALVKNVQSFVDAYNDVLSSLNSKVGEERYKKYAPLTTEQRAGMSDDEAALWTTKAKSGMLKNDSILQDTVSDMRNAMVQGVDIGRPPKSDGTKDLLSLSELGITTGGYETKGKLVLDADKLKAALDTDPNIISKFFGSQDPATRLTNTASDKDGIIAKLKKIGNVSLQRMAETAGTSKVSSSLTATFISNSSMGQELTSLDKRISEMTSRLNNVETNYYKKFTAMEKAINRYNSSSSSLAGM